MRRLFVDTSAYFALTDKRDENHEAAVYFIHHLIRESAELLTTNYIVAETHTLLLNRIGYATALQVLEDLYKSQTRIYRVREAVLADANGAFVALNNQADPGNDFYTTPVVNP
jgi:uncharacterized protein